MAIEPRELAVETTEQLIVSSEQVVVPGDSSILLAYFECDSTNKVLMRSISEQKSSNALTSVEFDSGRISYKLKRMSDTITSRIDTIFTNRKEAFVESKALEIQYKMTRIQTLFYSIGIISSCIVVILLFLKVRNFLKLK
jgi:hypothetical protein